MRSLSIFLILITPVVVYFSGIYGKRNVAVFMAIISTVFTVSATVPEYPKFISGVVVGYAFAVLAFHLIAFSLKTLGFDTVQPLTKHENKKRA